MSSHKNKIHTDLPLQYLEHIPSNTIDLNNSNRPLVIFLHGYGSNEEDLFELKDEFKPEYTYLSVRAPMKIHNGSYQWFSLQVPTGGLNQVAKELHDNGKLLEEFIKAAVIKYETSSEKVFLVGFSQGAIMSYELALKKPLSVRGIIALSGMILPTLNDQITSIMDLKNLAVFIGHGVLDDRIPVSAGKSAFETLSKTSIKPEFHSYVNLGHSINQKEIEDINGWLAKVLSTKR